MDVDVAIAGAGPAGLSLACALAPLGLRLALIERQPRAALADPAFDGREIALNHPSRRLLETLDIWPGIPAEAVSPLRTAEVFDGDDPRPMTVAAPGADAPPLGWLVPNHAIRRAAFARALSFDAVDLLADTAVTAAHTSADAVRLALADGRTVNARLLVAADGRFSGLRRQLGVPTRTHDHGRSMLVCRMTHEADHRHAAWQWFGYGQTLALLPLNGGHLSSVVLTLPTPDLARVARLDDTAFAADIERRFQGRLGAMRAAGSRHGYPLVGVYAERFTGPRYALLGDTAVGMHPITAHGFNFGLAGVATLSGQIARALRDGRDPGGAEVLDAYARAHRRATGPLYRTTDAVASLFTDERPPARWLRRAALGVARSAAPFRQAIATRLIR